MNEAIQNYLIDCLGDEKLRKRLIITGFRKIVIQRDFYKKFGYKIPTKKPHTFNEKINWVKLYRKDERMAALTDKYLVRGWVKRTVGKKYVIPMYGVYNSIEEFKQALPTLPNRFVVKATNGGGGQEVFLCKDKKKIEWESKCQQMARWFSNKPYYRGGAWQYKDLKSRIICEKMLGEDVEDFKLFCFGGKVALIQVDLARFRGHKQQFFNTTWDLQPILYVAEPGKEIYPKPDNLEELIAVAEKLATGFDFVRVDLYNVNNKIYFGEMTFSPNNGLTGFKPKEWDKKLGDLWKLDESRKRISVKELRK